MNKWNDGDKLLCVSFDEDYYQPVIPGQIYTYDGLDASGYHRNDPEWLNLKERDHQAGYERHHFININQASERQIKYIKIILGLI